MTITSDQPRALTREELYALFKTQRAVRAFEQLFDLVPDELIILQENIEAATFEAGAANSSANEALAQLTRIADSLERLALAPLPPQGTMAEQSADNVLVGSGSGFLRALGITPWGNKALVTQINGGGIPQFQTIGNNANTSSYGAVRYSNNQFGAYVYFCKSRSATIGGNTIVQNGDTLGSFVWNPNNGADFNTGSARLWVQVDDPVPAGSVIGASWQLALMDQSGAENTVYRIRSEMQHDLRIKTSQAAAWRVGIDAVGVGDDYININTTIGFEVVSFGNTSIDPLFDFLGSGGVRIGGGFGMAGVGVQTQQSHIADPAGGGTVDTEARTAINSILVVLETFGFTATF